MLIATVAALMLIFGGADFSFNMYNKAAQSVIQDKGRAKQIKAITKEANKEFKTVYKYFNKSSKELVEAVTRPDVTEEQLITLFDGIETRREEFQEKIIKLRFQAKGLTSPAEWEAMQAELK